ncbi:hypothetical protein M0R72_12355 [Candidatus Pacearchaeota archaeon]|jgi:hypothetical protein|nr:hypothetical protein [Candidatus Pacearchaeota archaeon]
MKLINIILVASVLMLVMGGGLAAKSGPIEMREGANITLDGGYINGQSTSYGYSAVVLQDETNVWAINESGMLIAGPTALANSQLVIQAAHNKKGRMYITPGKYPISVGLHPVNNSTIEMDVNTTLVNQHGSESIFYMLDTKLDNFKMVGGNLVCKPSGGGAWYSAGGVNNSDFISVNMFVPKGTSIAGFIAFFDASAGVGNSHNMIDGCTFRGTTGGQDQLGSGFSNTTVQNCKFYDGDGQGTANTDSRWCKYINNYFYNVSNPISLEHETYFNIIQGNHAYYSGSYKIGIPENDEHSHYNQIKDNENFYSTSTGITIGCGNGDIVTGNTVYRAKYGGFYGNMKNSIISNNEFVQNNWGAGAVTMDSVLIADGGIQLVNSSYEWYPGNNTVSNNKIWADGATWVHPFTGSSVRDYSGGVAISDPYVSDLVMMNTIRLAGDISLIDYIQYYGNTLVPGVPIIAHNYGYNAGGLVEVT